VTGVVRKVVGNDGDRRLIGYGFVHPGAEIDDFYFNLNDVVGEIHVGDEVDFWLADSPRRPGSLVAVEVTARARDVHGKHADTD
jgi:hypothetical protein